MLLILAAALTALPMAPAMPQQRAAVVLELSQGGAYLPGDSALVGVHVATDGYLLVLRADASGRVRVLFPLDPTDDAYVRGGREYHILARGDRGFSFLAEANGGTGTILAALSPDPLTPGMYALNDHWDYNVLARGDDDDELALRAIAEKLIRARFEYDVLAYYVQGAELAQEPLEAQGGGGSTSVMIGVGGCWGCGMAAWWGPGWGWGWNVGWGWGWGWAPVWAWGPAWGWGPGWGWGGGVWTPGLTPGNPGWTPGAPGGPDRFPGLGPGQATPYRPRVAGGERGGDMGVRGSLASNGTGYRNRGGAANPGGTTDLGVRGSLAASGTGYRARATTGTRTTASAGGGRAYTSGRGVRVSVPGRPSAGAVGRGGALGSRGYASPSGMGGRVAGGSRGTMTTPRGGGYSGYSGSARGMSGRGYSGGTRGFSGGSRGFSGGSRGFSGGGGRGR